MVDHGRATSICAATGAVPGARDRRRVRAGATHMPDGDAKPRPATKKAKKVAAAQVAATAAASIIGSNHATKIAGTATGCRLPLEDASEAAAGRRLLMSQAWMHTIHEMKKAQRESGTNSLVPTGAAWQPDACEPRAADGRAIERNRTLWFFGNSVTRIHFFAAHALLSTQELSRGAVSNVSILDQITHCGKGGEWKGRRPGQGMSCVGPCSCSLEVPGRAGWRLQFVWQQNTFDETLAKVLVGEYPRLPVAAGDMVIMSTGLDGVIETLKRAYTHKKTTGIDANGQPCRFRGNFSDFEARWRHTTQAAAPRLARAMLAAWRAGRRVFWRSSTPSCSSSIRGGDIFSPRVVNSMLAQYDAVLTAALTSLGAPVLDLRAIDMGVNDCDAREDDEAVNRCRCKGYLDKTGLHPGPQLAGRQVARLLAATDSRCRAAEGS